MAPKITTVVFDYGNVLVKLNRGKICKRLSRHSDLLPEEICNRIFENDIEYDSETGKYDSKEHFLRIKKRINAHDDWTYEEFYQEFKNGFDRNPDGERALKYAGKQSKVFVLSNTSRIHSQWLLERKKLSNIPTLFIFSFEVGVMKPDKRIWEILCEKGSVKPEECLYIDDISEYCTVAKEMGFNIINYDFKSMNLKNELSRWL